MDKKEAVRILEAMKFCARSLPQHCCGVGDCTNCQGYVRPGEDIEAFDVAIEAMNEE